MLTESCCNKLFPFWGCQYETFEKYSISFEFKEGKKLGVVLTSAIIKKNLSTNYAD